MRGDVAILPFEIQQWLSSCGFLQVQRFYLADNDQVITCSMFRVNFTIKPVQAAGNDWITQRRRLPIDIKPFVGTSPSELVGNPDLLTR